MMKFEVPQLMGQYGQQFILRYGVDQGIIENNALGPPHAGEVGVGVATALGPVHHEHTPKGKVDLLTEGLYALQQLTGRQGLKLVKERCDHQGIENQHEELEGRKKTEAPEPPVRPSPGAAIHTR